MHQQTRSMSGKAFKSEKFVNKALFVKTKLYFQMKGNPGEMLTKEVVKTGI